MPIRDNKFTRRPEHTSQARRRLQAGENVLTLDDQLSRLEDDIRRLKIEFDIFFNGATKRPPYDTKGRVDTIIKRISDDRTLTYAQRYRYNSLVARYTAFKELWRRTMQGREEGRDAAAAARASVRAEASQPHDPAVFVCSDAHKDIPTVRQIYEALIDAKAKCGEAVEDLSFPRFHQLIASKTDSIKEKLGCEGVRFSVSVEGGHVNFKAKPDKE